MRELVRAPLDLGTALLLLALGGGALWIGRDWPIGTLAEMEAGYFPRIVATALVLGGAVLLVRSFVTPGERISSVDIRPLAAVTAAVAGFALVIEAAGLALAILVVVLMSKLAGARLGLVGLIGLWVTVTAMCVAIFVWGVALPIPVWPI